MMSARGTQRPDLYAYRLQEEDFQTVPGTRFEIAYFNDKGIAVRDVDRPGSTEIRAHHQEMMVLLEHLSPREVASAGRSAPSPL
ncbi:hypothetical protein [Nonomuraea sp. KM90]|uniref:hypothetical protein n=1 Tax=Nonomuraea sp. KM90 TaxID=3457428 RepID=UPI003FCD076E